MGALIDVLVAKLLAVTKTAVVGASRDIDPATLIERIVAIFFAVAPQSVVRAGVAGVQALLQTLVAFLLAVAPQTIVRARIAGRDTIVDRLIAEFVSVTIHPIVRTGITRVYVAQPAQTRIGAVAKSAVVASRAVVLGPGHGTKRRKTNLARIGGVERSIGMTLAAYVTSTAITNRREIVAGGAAERFAGHINIGLLVDGHGIGHIVIIDRAIIARHPLQLAVAVILERRIIAVRSPAVRLADDINVFRHIHDQIVSDVRVGHRTVVARHPLLHTRRIVFDGDEILMSAACSPR